MEEFLKLFSMRDILFHIINTVILLVAITFLVYKPVRKFMNARTERVQGELDAAKDAQARADETMAEAEQARRAADEAAAKAQADGALRAQQAGDDLIADAKKQADDILRKAHEEAETIKAAAQRELQAQALAMAVQISEKMIGRELAERDNETLAREFLTKVG